MTTIQASDALRAKLQVPSAAQAGLKLGEVELHVERKKQEATIFMECRMWYCVSGMYVLGLYRFNEISHRVGMRAIVEIDSSRGISSKKIRSDAGMY